jgi:hypothetical protein
MPEITEEERAGGLPSALELESVRFFQVEYREDLGDDPEQHEGRVSYKQGAKVRNRPGLPLFIKWITGRSWKYICRI